MALSTRVERASTIYHCQYAYPAGNPFRFANFFTQVTRQAAGWMYAGVNAQDINTDEEPPTAAELTQRMDRYRDRRFTEYYPDPKKVFDI